MPDAIPRSVLAQRAARAVAHQGRVAAVQQAAGIAYCPVHRAVDGGHQVVVQCDGAGDRAQDLVDGGPAAVPGEERSDGDEEQNREERAATPRGGPLRRAELKGIVSSPGRPTTDARQPSASCAGSPATPAPPADRCGDTGGSGDSVVVPVPLVGGVPMPVMHVVDMSAVGHSDVSAATSVLVFVAFVRRVADGGALIRVTVVRAVDVSLVHVVDVVTVRNGDVSAAFLVPVIVGLVGVMLGGGHHDVLPMRIGWTAARRPLPRYRINIG